MKDFKIESRDPSFKDPDPSRDSKSSRFSLDLCRRVFMFFTDQIFKNSQCFPMAKKLNRVFVSKQAAKTCKHSAKQSVEILNSSEETKI